MNLSGKQVLRLFGTAFMVLLLVAVLPAGPGAAQEKNWTGTAGDGLWSAAGNWEPAGAPDTGDAVSLNVPATVTYDYSLNPGLGSVNIGSGNGAVVFNQSANTLTITGDNSLIVNGGFDGANRYAATYNLSGTGVLVKERFEVKIGTTGLGYFNQSGGTFQLSGALYMGDEATGHGTYTMTGGEITAGPGGLAGIVLGEWGGRGDFLQSGGTVTIDSLALARQAGSSGYYTLGGDPATVTLTLSTARVGAAGVGVFTQSGGTHRVTQELVLGEIDGGSSGNGTYDLNNGILAANNLYVGSGGTGTLNQAGGKNGVGYTFDASGNAVAIDGFHELIVGRFEGSNGAYSLSGGELYASREIIGDGGFLSPSAGTFTQSGNSTHTVLSDLIIGQDPLSQGTFTITDDGQLTVGGSLYLGDEGGTGLMTQSGMSTVNILGELNTGSSSENGGYETTLGNGTYELIGGTLIVAWAERIGLFGNGSFIQSSKSQHRVGFDLVLGSEVGSLGSYALNGGDLQVGQFDGLGNALQSGSTILGMNGIGTFTQRGGSHRISADLNIGQEAGSTGTYYLENGSLSVGRTEHVGLNGTGSFIQTGGTHTVGADLVLGNDAGAGTYILSGDSSVTLTVGGVAFVGLNGTGQFSQTGGVLTVTNDLNLGQFAGSTGEFNLGGTGAVNVGRTIYVGMGGTGVFTQSGNSRVNVTREDGGGGVILGSGDSGTGAGTYNLHGGTLTSNYMIVGAWGRGTVNQTGGTNTTGYLAIQENGIGAYNLSGGALNTANVNNNGTFNYSGGDLTATSTFSNNAGATAHISGVNSSIGSVINEGTFNVNGVLGITGGEFYQTAGILRGSGQINGNVFLSGGTVTPGNSPGVLTINGDYGQGESAILEIELLNNTTGSGYDQLSISGTATLDGTISLALLDGYTIMDGQTFDILHYGSLSGEFARWLGLDPDGSLYFTYEYMANDLILTAHIAEAPVPIPGAMWLFVPGLAGLAVLRKRLKA